LEGVGFGVHVSGVYFGFYFGDAGGDVEGGVAFGGAYAFDYIGEGLFEHHLGIWVLVCFISGVLGG